MGWTVADWSTKEEALEDELQGMTIIDKSFKGNVAYVAVEKKNGHVFGLVAMFNKQGREIGIKLVDESMGPYQIECPKRILNKLTPVEELYAENSGEWAKKWRENCIAHHARPKQPKLVEGMKVRFENTISFDGFEEQEFTVVRYGKSIVFRTTNGVLCRIKGYTKMDYTVIE